MENKKELLEKTKKALTKLSCAFLEMQQAGIFIEDSLKQNLFCLSLGIKAMVRDSQETKNV